MLIKNLIDNNSKQMKYADFMNGTTPIFSQFGQDIYASDVVQMCIDRIATECSKLMPRHIYTDNNGMEKVPKSDINRLFKFAPNPLMTTRDFIEKMIWLLYLNYNAFIYPVYVRTTDRNGNAKIKYTAFYPINPTMVEFMQDAAQKLFVKFSFSGGDEFTLPYSDVIHLRKRYSVNDVMGGGSGGQPDNEALLKVLNINDTVLQGIAKAITTSLTVRGVMKYKTMMDDGKILKEKEKFEEKISSGDTSILPLDLNNEYIPLNIDPKVIDSTTLEFLENKVLRWFNVSVPILSGKYTDDEYQAFYESALEPVLIGLGQAFSKCLFSQRELDIGNEIVFYQKNMMYLSTKSKLELLKTAGEQGLLTDDQKLAVLGYPPLKDGSGSRRTMSLNYIDVKLSNEYQLKKSSEGGKENGSN